MIWSEALAGICPRVIARLAPISAWVVSRQTRSAFDTSNRPACEAMRKSRIAKGPMIRNMASEITSERCSIWAQRTSLVAVSSTECRPKA
jgi:hypothetical protein